MIHGYHVIIPHYGFWLPNDPRGSWSNMVGSWELTLFGKTTRDLQRRTVAQLTEKEKYQRDLARKSLLYPPVTLTGGQARCVGMGFSKLAQKSQCVVWACSIMPEHTHLVVARHRYKVEQIVNLLKGSATSELIKDGLHPMLNFVDPEESLPKMWGRGQWVSFLEDHEGICNAIGYVKENPLKEGKPLQDWKWITPYRGLGSGWTTYR